MGSFALYFSLICAALSSSVFCEDRMVGLFPDQSGFSVAIPDGWKATEKPQQKYKVLISDNANIIVRDGDFQGPLADFVMQMRKGFKSAYPKFTELSTDALKTTEGKAFTRLVAKNEIGGQSVRQTFFMYDGPGSLKLALTCTVPSDGAEHFDNALDLCGKSLRFEKNTVVSEELTRGFDELMKKMVTHLKSSDELGKNPTDEVIRTKAVDPACLAVQSAKMLEATRDQEEAFAAGKFADDKNKQTADAMVSWLESFKYEHSVATRFIMAECKAGHLNGKELEISTRFLKWSVTKMTDFVKSVQPPAQSKSN